MAVSDRPWSDFTQADYTPAQWARASLIDTGEGDPGSKDRYKVQVREPDGTLNRNGAHAAAGGHGIMAVTGVSPSVKAAAARKLVAIYRQDLGEDPPESLLAMASSNRSLVPDVDPAGTIGSGVHYRTFAPDLQVRPGGDGRTVYGIAVPYGVPVRIDDDLIEQFARGAFNHQLDRPQRVKFAREHVLLGGVMIGAASVLRDDAAGLYTELRTARTPAGDETLELIRDGALDQMSIMFREGRNRRLTGGITERVRADLREVAMVMEGAYGDYAVAAGVRSAAVGPPVAAGAPRTAADFALRLQAEEYLLGPLPELRDYDTEIRAINLGIR